MKLSAFLPTMFRANTATKLAPQRAVSGGTSDLFSPQAVDALAEMLTRFPDPDETLAAAGLSRANLRVLTHDDEIESALETRLAAVLGTPWRLEPGDGPATDFLYEQLEPIAEAAISGIWQAVPYGYSVLELTYARQGGRDVIASLDERPFEWFSVRPSGELRYHPSDYRAGSEGLAVDEEMKFFLSRRRATYRQPYGESVLSRLYWPWFFRMKGWQFWARFLERFGAPLLVGKTSGETDKMLAALSQAVASAAIAVASDEDVSAIAPNNAGDAFERFEIASAKRVQKVVLGQTLTTDTQGVGSQALGNVHNEVRGDRKSADVRLVTRTMQRIVDALLARNFAGQQVSFVMEDSAGLEMPRAERDAKLVSAGVLKLTPQYLIDRYDFEEGDFTVPEGPPKPLPSPPSAQASLLAPLVRFSGGRFTAAQRDVEDVAAKAIESAGQPIDPKLIRKAVLAAKTPEDLADRLAVLMQGADQTTFAAALEAAYFTADVIGYVNAEEP